MPDQSINSLSTEEIITYIENNFSESQQNEIVKIFFRCGHTIVPSELLTTLLNKNIICVSALPMIGYKLEKYFDKYGIEKLSARKEFIFSKIPNLEGLKRGKSASYDDVVNYVSEKYPDIMNNLLSEIIVYDYTPQYKENAPICNLYFNRKLNPKANYKYDPKIGHYILKEDDVTKLLRDHGVNFEVENPDELFSVLNVSFDETSEYIKNGAKLNFLKIILLIIFWPIGLYVLYKNYMRDK